MIGNVFKEKELDSETSVEIVIRDIDSWLNIVYNLAIKEARYADYSDERLKKYSRNRKEMC